MAHEGYHEPYELLPDAIRNLHRAFVSVTEELEAADWYYQRAAACEDASLRAILLHNAHEELEHAAMALEWLRRNDAVFDQRLRTYLFREGDIVVAENAAKAPEPAGPNGSAVETRATLGSLRPQGERA